MRLTVGILAAIDAAPLGAAGKLDPIVTWLASFHERWPLVGLLIFLMALDVLMGFFAAFVTKTVSSTVCSRGMVRKVMILMLVSMCIAIEPYASDIPLSKLAAMAFIVFECTSILENAARSGLPIPSAITDTLAMIKQADKQKPSIIPPVIPPPIVPPANQNVSINRATNVDIHSDGTETGKSKADSVIIKNGSVSSPGEVFKP